MMISSKGRYALRAMIDLAEQQKTEYIPLKEIAERQNISQKYLESIMTILSKSNYIDALFLDNVCIADLMSAEDMSNI